MLIISITNACNFHCKTCLREHPNDIGHISLEIVEKALQEYKKLNAEPVIGITGGEPCLHPDFEKIVEIIVQNGFYFRFVSNGSLLDKYKFIAEKYKKNAKLAAFSLDSSDKEIHNEVRDHGSFEKVKETIRYFSLEGIHTRVNSCLNRINIHQIEEIIVLAKELGAKEIYFMSAIKTLLNSKIVFTDVEKQRHKNYIYQLGRKHDFKVHVLSSLGNKSGIEFCPALNLEAIQVNQKGEVSFCCDIIGAGASVGSLENNSFGELYSKCLDLSCDLKKTRVKLLESGVVMEGFNTCEFCNLFLSRYIKNT
ncbi:MAG: radical SAM protein [Candidatus Moraniibacteriota bacterium]